MVQNPEHLIDSFVEAGASCVSVHAEAACHLDRAVRYIKSRGIRAGVALNPATPLSAIYYVLGFTDIVVLMTVNPGYGGQQFIDYCLSKIEALRGEIRTRKLPTLIEVDGGVKLDNIGKIAHAGADVFVAGTAVFGGGDYAAAIRDLRAAAEQGLQK
jgi:ribulose-phosphate 3-epimerase